MHNCFLVSPKHSPLNKRKVPQVTPTTNMKKQRFNRIPEIGTPVELIASYVQQKPDPQGEVGTPMCKIRYDNDQQMWKMVPLDHAGLMVFLNDVPEVGNKCIKISKIVGSGNAAYADVVVSCQ